MKLKNKTIGLAISGSYCNFKYVEELITTLKSSGATIIPIISKNVKDVSTRFYDKKEFIKMLEEKCETKVIDTIAKAEPIGPKNIIDLLVIIPCTGNTLAKIATGITDTAVTMIFKGHVRNSKPVVIGISTNDGLGANFKNIGMLYNTKDVYFVPFGQDDSSLKPKSLVLDYSKVIPCITEAFKHRQIQPVLIKS